MMTNADRAARAFKALKGGDYLEDGTMYPYHVGDLLADLHHLCDRDGVDWVQQQGMGAMHYEAELKGQ